MRQTAVSHPPRSSVPPRFEDALAHEESPRESLTRLIASPQVLGESGSVAHTRPTTPVPTDYLFLNQRGLEDGTGILAGRLADLADEGDEGDEGDALEGAFSALERFVELERNPEPLAAAVLTLIDSGTRPRVVDTPS